MTSPAIAVTAAKIKALNVSVLRAADRTDCTNRGVSSRYSNLAIVGTVNHIYPNDLANRKVTPLKADLSLPDYVQRAEGEQYAAAPVALVFRNMGSEILLHLQPVEQTEDGYVLIGGWVMAGGIYAATSDSRLKEIVRAIAPAGAFYGALSVHDRQEAYR